MNSCALSVITLATSLHGGFLAMLQAGAEPKDSRPLTVCGPRCTQQILQHYGQEVDLVDLINEMQHGLTSETSTLSDIQSALRRRGVQSLPLKLGFLEFPTWHQPVILHYGSDHFVLLEATNGAYAKIRDGPAHTSSWQLIPTVMLRGTDVALLTSPLPIQRETVTLVHWPRYLVAMGCLAMGGISLLASRRLRLSFHSICKVVLD
jgi:hypothetical protein